jgi:hypothetical protein
MLQDIKKSLIDCASGLNLGTNFEKMDITMLANGYCDADEAHDEDKRSQYYSAIMLHYWYKIYEYQKTCASLRLPIEEYVDWLSESMDWAFRYRRWRDPNDKNYNDPNGVDKIFNRCFFSTRGRHYQHSNKDNRKINYTAASLDKIVEDVGDHSEVFTADESFQMEKDIVDLFVKKRKYMEALVLDGILYQNVFETEKSSKEVEVYVEDEAEFEDEPVEGHLETVEVDAYDTNFNVKRLVKHLKNLNEDFMDYFVSFYSLDENEERELKEKINSLKPSSIRRVVEKTLYNLSKEKEVLNFVAR